MAKRHPDSREQAPRRALDPSDPVEHDDLAKSGAAAGAAGLMPQRGPEDESDEGMPGDAAVIGISGVSGGGRSTTRILNTRK